MQDGEVVVWHDNQITAEKCLDTHPVVSCKTFLHIIFSSVSESSLTTLRTHMSANLLLT